MKESNPIEAKLALSLKSWSRDELDRLFEMLADSKARGRILSLLSELTVRKSQAKRRSARQTPAKGGSRARLEQDSGPFLASLICDRARFPSTAALLHVLNSLWGTSYSPDEFRGARRQEIARAIWKELLALSPAERQARVALLDAGARADDDAYIDLFRKIATK